MLARSYEVQVRGVPDSMDNFHESSIKMQETMTIVEGKAVGSTAVPLCCGQD